MCAAFWLFVVVGVGFILLCLCVEAREWRAYRKSHPPLSDEEFVQRCSSDVPPELALRIRELFAQYSGVDAAIIYPDTRIVDDLKLC